MRIVSLLPSLTELVCALGRGDDLVGVTHECDYPPGVEEKPQLTRSRIPGGTSSGEIDALVRQQSGSLYELDEALLAELRPDLILTQEQCDVCAVNESAVRHAAMKLTRRPQVESVNPTTLAEVLAMFGRVGAFLGRAEQAEELVARFEATAQELSRRRAPDSPARSDPESLRVLLLEWLDPPFSSGHWNPEIIHLAGGVDPVGQAGQKSRSISWNDVAASHADVILVAPCGFTLDRALAELDAFRNRSEWRDLAAVRNGRVVVIDGSAYFSRPGPRLETSLRIAAAAIDPERFRDLAPPEGRGWRSLLVTA
jgi:iron complex transport system substrate-binding protein